MRAPIAVVALVALLPLLLSGCVSFWTGAKDLPAPDFQLLDVDGAPQNLTDHAGNYLLLDFMGTWCGPCQRGVGDLRALQDQYPDMEILSISSTDTDAQMRDFRAQYGVTWPMAVDTDRVVQRYAETTGTHTWTWPSYALVDPDGRIVFWNRGETLPATLAAALEDATGTRTPAGSGVAAPAILALLLGSTIPLSPYLLRSTLPRDPDARPPLIRTAIVLAGLMGLLAWGVVAAGRPLTGRIHNVAGLAALAGLISIGWWRSKGTDAVQGTGRWLHADPSWRAAAGIAFRLLYVAAPVWLAVTLAAFGRTVPAESLLMMVALALGAVVACAVLAADGLQRWLGARGDRVALVSVAGTVVASVWVGWMWLS